MKSLDTEKETIEKICDLLTEETLEPARAQADSLLEDAKKKADEIVEQARQEKAHLLEEADKEIAQKQNIFNSTMAQASAQSLEAIRQQIQSQLFDQKLTQLLDQQLKKPDVVADIIKAIVAAIEKEGLKADLRVVVSDTANTDEINQLIGQKVLKDLQGGSVQLAHMPSGVQVKLEGKELTIDMSLEAVREVVSSYVRSDLRTLIFGE